MNTTINTLGDVCPAGTLTVHDRTTRYTALPASRTEQIAAEAQQWLSYAIARSRMTPESLTKKAFQSACFSAASNASGYAIPTKLSAVRDHQRRLWTLVREGYGHYDELGLDTATTDGVSVSYGDAPIGQIQPKHAGWLRPLIPFGVRLYLARVTGHDQAGYVLGVNVVVGHVGEALTRLLDATKESSTSGDGSASGDGQTGRVLPVLSATNEEGGGDVEPKRSSLRLVTGAQHGPLGGDPDDVVLYREIDGTARATVPHVTRHSPTGVEWGYSGSGPADLARSILLALMPNAAVDRLYQAFKAEFVARVPYAGGLIRAAEVRAWVQRQTSEL
jgi:hypothetical protein